MGRTVLMPHHREPERVEQMATNGNCSSQQQQEFHHWLHPKQATDWMGTPSYNGATLGIKESNRRGVSVEHATKQTDSHPRSQQNRPQGERSPKPMDNWTTRMARREEPTTTTWHC